MAKPRTVTRDAAQKYDVINIRIAVIYFGHFFSTSISQESFVYYQTISMHLKNELYGVILTAFKNSKYLSTVDY